MRREQFLDITQKQEKGGEVAHADVIKAQITLQQRQRDLQDGQLNIEKARIALGVLIFPDFRSDFSVADDVQQACICCRRCRKRWRRPRPRAPICSPRRSSAAGRPDTSQTSRDMAICRRWVWIFSTASMPTSSRRTRHAPESGRSTLPDYEVSTARILAIRRR